METIMGEVQQLAEEAGKEILEEVQQYAEEIEEDIMEEVQEHPSAASRENDPCTPFKELGDKIRGTCLHIHQTSKALK